MEGFVAKQEMPTYLSLLFRARRPLDPLRQVHRPVYDNRPLQPLIDCHHALGSPEGLLGHVSQERGEGWLKATFEEQTAPVEQPEARETKEAAAKRAQKAKIKQHLLEQKQAVRNCK